MKRLDELGVSPAPWDAAKSDCGVWSVFDRNGQSCQFREADARLMAAAPDLYEALREAVVHDCDSCEWNAADFSKCCCGGECGVKKARKALENAGGAK